MHFLWTNSWHFLSSAAFGWSNWDLFQKELVIEDSLPMPPCIHHHHLWMKIGLWHVGGDSFCLPQDLFHSALLYSIHFHHLSNFVFKTKCFCYIHVENCTEIRSRRVWFGFFCITYVEPRHQSNQHNQAGANDFQCLIQIFWVCWLSISCVV